MRAAYRPNLRSVEFLSFQVELSGARTPVTAIFATKNTHGLESPTMTCSGSAVIATQKRFLMSQKIHAWLSSGLLSGLLPASLRPTLGIKRDTQPRHKIIEMQKRK